MDTKKIFGARLAKLRTENNLTQQELADKLVLSRGQLGNYEQGTREPDYNTLRHLSDYFNVSIDYLLGRTDDPTGPNNRYITPDDLNISEIDKIELKKYIKYMVAIDDADAAEMTPEELQYLIKISKEAMALVKSKEM